MEGVAAAAVNGRAIAMHLPIAWYCKCRPSAVIEIGAPEPFGLFVWGGCPVEAPFPVEFHLAVARVCREAEEIGTWGFTVLLQYALVFPIVVDRHSRL